MPQADTHLLQAIRNAYVARAKLFHAGIQSADIVGLIADVDGVDDPGNWDLPNLAITETAFQKVSASGGKPHQVFAHPAIVENRPRLIRYYRNMVAISKKGIQQVLFSTDAYESGRRERMDADRCLQLCRALNGIISGVIDNFDEYTVELSRQTILAEVGTELQGSWVNVVGRGAAKRVRQIVEAYIAERNLGATEGTMIRLANGWSITFGSEPDVSFLDSQGTIQIAIEIKGSLDRAGAQSRYGEAKKSFGKALAANARCHTIYLASCFTDAVVRQIHIDGTVRDWFDLTAVLSDDHERQRFLSRVFHIVQTPR